MKAMILAAGRGERMGELTNTCPKPLLKIHGEPLIVHHIKKLAAIGVSDIVINVHYLAEQIMSVLGDGASLGVSIRYSVEKETRLETGGGIKNALPLLGNKAFILVSADIYSDYCYSNLLVRSKIAGGHLVMVSNPAYHLDGDFGLSLSGCLDQNATPRYTYANIGVLNPAIFDFFNAGPFPLVNVFRAAIRESKLSGEVHQGLWHNVGTPEILKSLNSLIPKP